MNENFSMIDPARHMVVAYFNAHKDKTDDFTMQIQNTYCVWFCKTLQNWKALVSTVVSDGLYYEITYNGDKNEAYIDVYKKWDNQCISGSDMPY